MNEIIQSILSNIAIIFLMHLCIDILIKKRSTFSYDYFPAVIVAIISISVITMFYLPIKFGGFHLDLRLIPLIFFAYKWGWKYAMPALLITSLWRLGMGGAGAVPGVIFGMVLPVLAGLVFRKKVKDAPRIRSVALFWLMFSAWFICDVPIIFIVPDGLAVFKEIVFYRFISFILTGFTLNFFIKNTEKELRMKEQLQYYAERDPLTALYNIRFFETKMKSFPISKKHNYIIMIDIDHFKSINDTFGHINGDSVLKDVANVLVDRVSRHNKVESIIGRYGGEEFIVFLSAIFKKDMERVVEDIRKEIESTIFYTADKKHKIRLTVSIGVSEMKDYSQVRKTIEQADQSLYKSKKNGRNQVSYV